MTEGKNQDNRYSIETELTNWEDIFKLDQRFLINFIYLGQQNMEWDLSTSFERNFGNNIHLTIDKRLFWNKMLYFF